LQFASVNWTFYHKIIVACREEKREMSEHLCACELELLVVKNSISDLRLLKKGNPRRHTTREVIFQK